MAAGARPRSSPCAVTWGRRLCREEYDRQLDFDVGLLTVTQPNAVQDAGVLAGNAAATQDIATKITQSLFNKLFALPTSAIPGGLLAQLPHPTDPLPRAKPVPKPKPLTKWEQFAKEKGIVKKKNSKLEFDEVSQQWKRKHGYKKANDPMAVPIIDAEEGDQVLLTHPHANIHLHTPHPTSLPVWDGACAACASSDQGGLPCNTRAHCQLDDLPISCRFNGKRSNGVYPTSIAQAVAPATSLP